jgi:hypothetical protein
MAPGFGAAIRSLRTALLRMQFRRMVWAVELGEKLTAY